MCDCTPHDRDHGGQGGKGRGGRGGRGGGGARGARGGGRGGGKSGSSGGDSDKQKGGKGSATPGGRGGSAARGRGGPRGGGRPHSQNKGPDASKEKGADPGISQQDLSGMLQSLAGKDDVSFTVVTVHGKGAQLEETSEDAKTRPPNKAKGQQKQNEHSSKKKESLADARSDPISCKKKFYTQAELRGEMTGKVVNIVKDFGFILPEKNLPAPYDKEASVFFHNNNVKGKAVDVNYTVAFRLNLEKLDKPGATYVRSTPPKKPTGQAQATGSQTGQNRKKTPKMETFTYPDCGHRGSKRPDQAITDIPCTQPCAKKLACGHQCQKLCVQYCARKGECPLCIEKGHGDSGHQAKKVEREKNREILVSDITDELAKMVVRKKKKATHFTTNEVKAKSEQTKFKNLVKQFLGVKAEVSAVYEVENQFLREKWLQARLLMHEPLHHHNRFLVVPKVTADEILKHGFKALSSLGREEKPSYSHTEDKVLLYCDVLSGRAYTVDKDILTRDELEQRKFDTMYFSKMIMPLPDSFVVVARHAVPDPDFVLATHMVHYKMQDTEDRDQGSTAGDSDTESVSSGVDIPVSNAVYTEEEVGGILIGTITNIKGNAGFLRAEKKLPNPYNQQRDIFFSPKDIGAVKTSKGARVAFLLEKSLYKKPAVLDIGMMTEGEGTPYIQIDCGHIAFLDPSGRMASQACQKRCVRALMCGHQCKNRCSETCSGTCGECMESEVEGEAAAAFGGTPIDVPTDQPAEKSGLSEILERREIIRDCATRLEEISQVTVNPQNFVTAFELSEDQKAAAVGQLSQEFGECQLKSAYRVENPSVEAHWLKARMAMNNPCYIEENQIYKTTERQALDIGMQGFTQTDMEMNRGERHQSSSTFALIVCDVLSGNVHQHRQGNPVPDSSYLATNHCDTFTVPTGCDMSVNAIKFEELYILNPDLILPRLIFIILPPRENKVSTADVLEMEAGKNVSNPIQKHRLNARRGFDCSNPLDMNYRIVESQFLRFVQKMEGNYEIDSVDYFINPALVCDFYQTKHEFEEKFGENELSRYVLAFHGTDPANVDSIIQSNFQISKSQRALFGQGIYLSEYPHVSMKFGGSLLLCKVLPGLSFDVSDTMKDASLQPGYDSHRVKADKQGYGWALVIFNPRQILPCYLINYRRTDVPPPSLPLTLSPQSSHQIRQDAAKGRVSLGFQPKTTTSMGMTSQFSSANQAAEAQMGSGFVVVEKDPLQTFMQETVTGAVRAYQHSKKKSKSKDDCCLQ